MRLGLCLDRMDQQECMSQRVSPGHWLHTWSALIWRSPCISRQVPRLVVGLLCRLAVAVLLLRFLTTW